MSRRVSAKTVSRTRRSKEPEFPAIKELLSRLGDTGDGGFEGLVGLLLGAATGQEFRRAGAGPQAGLDLESEPRLAANRIKVECKHYKKASLKPRELVAEINQAMMASDFDLWVLVASCKVNKTHATEIEDNAHRRGVECLFVDRGSDGLSRLDVLMACHVAEVARFCARHLEGVDAAPAIAALEGVAADPRFPSARGSIEAKLKGTLLGYDDARRRAADALLATLSDRGNSEATFRQSLAVNDPAVRNVPRANLRRHLDAWWQGEGCPHAAVVDEGGFGKSWAALDWISRRVADPGFPLVITILASACAIGPGEGLAEVMPRVLAGQIGIHTEEAWTARLGRWLKEDARRKPVLFILVDGLNEKPGLVWTSFFAVLRHSAWRDRVRVLATDRAGHWEPNCRVLSQQRHFLTVPVGRFGDAELEQAFEDSGLSIDDVPEGRLRDIARIPLYCGLLRDHLEEMIEAGDPTIERLIYLDVIYRRSIRLDYILNSDEIGEVIAAAADRYRSGAETFAPGEVERLCPFGHFDRSKYEELITGGMFNRHRRGGRTVYLIDPTRLTYGLGMLLAEDVRIACGEDRASDEIGEMIAVWMEPHPGADLKVACLESALFHAYIADFPTSGRRELIAAWLIARNVSQSGQLAFASYVTRQPDDFLSLVPRFWTSDHGYAQDFLARAFLAHRDHPAVLPRLSAEAVKWMGFVHPLGHPLLRHDRARTEATRDAIARRVGHQLHPGPLCFLREDLEVVQNDGLLRLKRLVFLLTSAGARLPFAPAFARWAAASTLHGHAIENDIADWVVRFAPDACALEQPMLANARRLIESGNDGRVAASILLSPLGTVAANALIERFPPDPDPVREERIAAHRANPCDSIFAWSEAERQQCLGRPDVTLGRVLTRAGRALFDPTSPFPDPALRVAEAAFAALDPMLIKASLVRNAETERFDALLPILATRSPRLLAPFIRRVVATIGGRDVEGRRHLALWLPEISPLLDVEGKLDLDRLLEDLRSAADGWAMPDGRSAENASQLTEAYVTLARLPGMSPAERFAAILARPRHAVDLLDLEAAFSPIDPPLFAAAIDRLGTDDEESARRLLWMAPSASPGPVLSQSRRDRLSGFIRASSRFTRWFALRHVFLSGDAATGGDVVEIIGDAYASCDPSNEAEWGTRCIVRYSGRLDFVEAASRTNPAAAGRLLVARGSIASEASRYADLLDAGVTVILGASDDVRVPAATVHVPPPEGAVGNEILDFVDPPSGGTTLISADATWGGVGNTLSLSDVLSPFRGLEDWRDRSLRIEERRSTFAAERALAPNAWVARSFDPAALAAVLSCRPELLGRWSDAALSADRRGAIARKRLGSFYAALCEAAFGSDPQLALRLWRKLRSERDNPSQVDLIALLFRVASVPEVDIARREALDGCSDDQALAEFAVTALQHGAEAWLADAVLSYVNEAPLHRRARGLMLAGLIDLAPQAFEDVVEGAHCEGSWLEDLLPHCRSAHLENVWARTWYERALEEADPSIWWAHLQAALGCADARFQVWRRGIEAAGGVGVAGKTMHLEINGRRIRSAIDRSEKRKGHLFGIKVPTGQVAPFLDD